MPWHRGPRRLRFVGMTGVSRWMIPSHVRSSIQQRVTTFAPTLARKPEMIRTLWRRVTYVLRGGQFGVEPGYVVLGLTEETRHISAEDLKRLTV